MTATTHGYSGKPLFQKIGVQPGMTLLAVNAPPHYRELMQGVEDVGFAQLTDLSNADGQYDIVHLFCADAGRLAPALQPALAAVRERGMFWVSWPKKSSAMFVDLSENDIRDAVLPHGWVDVKVCAVDQDWSGLKFLRRRQKAT